MILELKIVGESKIVFIGKSVLSRTLNVIVSIDGNAGVVIKDKAVTALKALRGSDITLDTIYDKESTLHTTLVLNLILVWTLFHTLVLIKELTINTQLTLVINAYAATLLFTLKSIITHISQLVNVYIFVFHKSITYICLFIPYVHCAHHYF